MAGTGAPDLRVVGGQEGGPEDIVGEYLATLGGRSASTVDAYGRILRSLAGWVAERPGGSGGFRPDLLTRTALETYLKELEGRGYSVSHRSRVKSVASGFAGWLIEEKGLLRKNPARGVEVPAQALLAPRRLSPDQRKKSDSASAVQFTRNHAFLPGTANPTPGGGFAHMQLSGHFPVRPVPRGYGAVYPGAQWVMKPDLRNDGDGVERFG